MRKKKNTAQKRFELNERYNDTLKEYINLGYRTQETHISIIKASIYGILLAGLLCIGAYIWFHSVWPNIDPVYNSYLLLALMLISILLHEILHGVGFYLSTGRKWKGNNSYRRAVA